MGKFICSIRKKLELLCQFVNPFWAQVCYFMCLSAVGFLALKALKPRTELYRVIDMDMFFMSVSASTMSSMTTIEMEFFSNTQLIVFAFLMVLGGEVFVSALELSLSYYKIKIHKTKKNADSPVTHHQNSSKIESSLVDAGDVLKHNSVRYLSYVVWCYLFVIQVVGYGLISMYMDFVPSAREALKNKGLHIGTFSVFTTVSTFANCGLLPTNENMIVFRKYPGLLLLVMPQGLLGNVLYAPCLRFLIWVLGRFTKRPEPNYLLMKDPSEIGYNHFLPFLHSCLLVVTVFVFIVIQFILFCCMEWNSEALNGLTNYQKLVAALFQCVNSRQVGESIADLAVIAPAIVVLFVVMMYLPPYTSFLPTKVGEKSIPTSCEKRKKRKQRLMENLLFSQLSNLAIFIIIICITEREKLRKDPINFSVLNIVIEVISAYGNVGLTTGYSCERQLKQDGYCKDSWYGFSGRWSNQGKLVLIIVMFFGRLKKFNMNGGKGWILL